MSALRMSRALAWAASVDAANRQAGKREAWNPVQPRPKTCNGTPIWNADDANLAVETFHRMWPLEAEYPWMTKGQADAARRQLGITGQR